MFFYKYPLIFVKQLFFCFLLCIHVAYVSADEISKLEQELAEIEQQAAGAEVALSAAKEKHQVLKDLVSKPKQALDKASNQLHSLRRELIDTEVALAKSLPSSEKQKAWESWEKSSQTKEDFRQLYKTFNGKLPDNSDYDDFLDLHLKKIKFDVDSDVAAQQIQSILRDTITAVISSASQSRALVTELTDEASEWYSNPKGQLTAIVEENIDEAKGELCVAVADEADQSALTAYVAGGAVGLSKLCDVTGELEEAVDGLIQDTFMQALATGKESSSTTVAALSQYTDFLLGGDLLEDKGLQERYAALKERVTKLSQALEQARPPVKSLSRKVQGVEETIRKLDGAIAEIQKDISKLTQSLESTQQKIDIARTRQARLEWLEQQADAISGGMFLGANAGTGSRRNFSADDLTKNLFPDLKTGTTLFITGRAARLEPKEIDGKLCNVPVYGPAEDVSQGLELEGGGSLTKKDGGVYVYTPAKEAGEPILVLPQWKIETTAAKDEDSCDTYKRVQIEEKRYNLGQVWKVTDVIYESVDAQGKPTSENNTQLQHSRLKATAKVSRGGDVSEQDVTKQLQGYVLNPGLGKHKGKVWLQGSERKYFEHNFEYANIGEAELTTTIQKDSRAVSTGNSSVTLYPGGRAEIIFRVHGHIFSDKGYSVHWNLDGRDVGPIKVENAITSLKAQSDGYYEARTTISADSGFNYASGYKGSTAGINTEVYFQGKKLSLGRIQSATVYAKAPRLQSIDIVGTSVAGGQLNSLLAIDVIHNQSSGGDAIDPNRRIDAINWPSWRFALKATDELKNKRLLSGSVNELERAVSNRSIGEDYITVSHEQFYDSGKQIFEDLIRVTRNKASVKPDISDDGKLAYTITINGPADMSRYQAVWQNGETTSFTQGEGGWVSTASEPGNGVEIKGESGTVLAAWSLPSSSEPLRLEINPPTWVSTGDTTLVATVKGGNNLLPQGLVCRWLGPGAEWLANQESEVSFNGESNECFNTLKIPTNIPADLKEIPPITVQLVLPGSES